MCIGLLEITYDECKMKTTTQMNCQNRQWKHSRTQTLVWCVFVLFLAKITLRFGWAYTTMFCTFTSVGCCCCCFHTTKAFVSVCIFFQRVLALFIIMHVYSYTFFCVNTFTSRFLPYFCRHTFYEVRSAYIIRLFQSIWFYFDSERERESNKKYIYINAIHNQMYDNNSAI